MGLLLQEPQDVRRIGFGEELRKELLSAGVVTIKHLDEQAVVSEKAVGFKNRVKSVFWFLISPASFAASGKAFKKV
jgi:hypothetical protein